MHSGLTMMQTEAHRRVLWLGAGFSHCVTNGQLPLMSGFFDCLAAKKHPALCSFIGSLTWQNPSIEVVMAELEAAEDIPVSGDAGKDLGCELDFTTIRAELNHYCISRLCADEVEVNDWAWDFLVRVGRGATVITTNYDNVAERILSNISHCNHGVSGTDCPHCKMCAILEDRCACDARMTVRKDEWRGSILKLHGSVAWKVCRNQSCASFGCILPDAHCRPVRDQVCRCCGGRADPVLVLPSPSKRYGEFPAIHRMWDGACSALKHATQIVIFGYSFPQTDKAIARLFEGELRKSRQLRDVCVVDLEPHAVAERFRSTASPRSRVSIDYLAVPERGAPEWWVCSSGIG